MKINPIKFHNILNFYPAINRVPSFCGLKEDVFEKQTENSNTPYGVDNSIKKMSKNSNGRVLDYITSGGMRQMAEETYEMAKLAEKRFDKKYGENNYIIVSIGTSPAGIAKSLELRGHDVRYLPISEIRNARPAKVLRYMSSDKHPEYMEYLDFIGIRKDEINESKKPYLFIDYTVSGKTLGALEKFAYQNGVDPKKARFLSINDELDKYTSGNLRKNARVRQYFNDYCLTQTIGRFSGIPHIPFYETSLIAESNKDPYFDADKKEFEELLCAYHFKDQKSAKNHV